MEGGEEKAKEENNERKQQSPSPSLFLETKTENEILKRIGDLQEKMESKESDTEETFWKNVELAREYVNLWKWKEMKFNKKNKKGSLQEIKEHLIFSTMYYQKAIEIYENESTKAEIRDINIELADTYVITARKYGILPFYERAKEKYHEVYISAQTKSKMIEMIQRIAKTYYLKALMNVNSESDIETSRVGANMQRANMNYIDLYIYIKAEMKNMNEKNGGGGQGLIPPLFKTSIKSFQPYRSSVPTIFPLTNENEPVDIHDDDGGDDDYDMKMMKMIEKLSLELEEKEWLEVREKICFDTLLEWGELELKLAKRVERLGDLRLALRLYFSSYIKFYRALKLYPNSMKTFQLWSKTIDAMGEIPCEDPSVNLSLVVRHYLDNFVILSEKFGLLNLKPIIALSLSGNPHIKSADPISVLTILSQNPNESIAKEATGNLEFIKLILQDRQENDMNSINEKELILSIEDFELAFQSLPPTAKKLFEKSGVSQEEIRDYKFLIINILLFLTDYHDWPSHLITCQKHRYHCNPIISDLPPFIEKDPNKEFRKKVYLGEGGFSKVFYVKDKTSKHHSPSNHHHHHHPRSLALKIFKKKYTEAEKQINREIYLLSQCKHPNIIEFKASYLWNNSVWLAMEYCSGGSLHKLISLIPLSERHIAYFAKEILKGLQYLHHKKIIHRDIKADNIFLYLSGRVTIGDLGLCVEVRGEMEVLPLCGSRCWIAPEMIHKRPYGLPVDIWSFGCVLLEMANGRPPYFEFSPLKSILLTATKGSPKLNRPGKWSAEFVHFVNCCLIVNPQSRCTAEQLLTHPFIATACSVREILPLLKEAFVNPLKASGLM